MATTKKRSNQFVVDLGDVELPAETARQLSADIRKLVLTAIAGIDLKGDLRVATRVPKALGPGPQTEGIWVDVQKNVT